MRSPWPSPLLALAIVAVLALALARSGDVRERAEAGLGRGMPPREAALARGFVLGQEEGLDSRTEEDFRRAGLAHLLAVSGQNVALLALLATPLLAALGIPLRERLLWLLALIAAYVPLAGAEPSIQRAAVMGAVSIVATLAERRSSRLYALAVAAALTLAVDPGVAGDVGWQLSFAAVLGILALAAPLRGWLLGRLGEGSWRRALAEGAAVTAAATLATAPLVAFHFERLSTTTLVANLLAMPAVAPAMWLGMLSAAAAQLPGAPVEPFNRLAAPLLAYIAQIAAWLGRPRWAEVEVRLGTGGLLAAYLVLIGAALAVAAAARGLRLARLRAGVTARSPGRRPRHVLPLFCLALVALALAWLRPPGTSSPEAVPVRPPGALRVAVLDVGQGDAILLQPPRAPALLVDAGPEGAGLVGELRRLGVRRLGAALVSHDQSDHTGGLGELLGAVAVERLAYARLDRSSRQLAAGAGVPLARLSAGASLRSGRLRLEVLWPPRERLASPLGSGEANAESLVLRASWGRFSMLLSGDAEAESVPLRPGPVDVLKVAHHGSEDAGLAALLESSRPRLAVVSAGAGNPFGHPTAATLATLAAHGVRTLRTDRDGTVVLDVAAGRLAISTAE